MKSLLKRLVLEEAGQDIIEYGLLAAGISVVAVPLVPSVGTWVNNKWQEINDKLAGK